MMAYEKSDPVLQFSRVCIMHEIRPRPVEHRSSEPTAATAIQAQWQSAHVWLGNRRAGRKQQTSTAPSAVEVHMSSSLQRLARERYNLTFRSDLFRLAVGRTVARGT